MDFTKLEIHGKTYTIKDSGARELIEGLDEKIDVNVEVLNNDIARLEAEIQDLPGDWAITVVDETFTFVRGGNDG